jgi:23S rRNA pseudouridine2605 synthase
MLAAVGHPVRRLVRVRVGPLRDGNLPPGAWRRLTLAEVRKLAEAAGGGPLPPGP